MLYRALTLLVCVFLLPVAPSKDEPVAGGGTGLLGLDPQQALDSQPVTYIPNLGQWDHDFAFTATAGPMLATFRGGGLLLDLVADKTETTLTTAVVGWSFEGGSASGPTGVGVLPGYHNYFLGSDDARWRSRVPLYAGLRYDEVWDGVDIVFGQLSGKLEYDVVLQPGAELEDVVVGVEGATDLFIEPDGTLVMETSVATIRQEAPKTWQVAANGTREEIECTYRVLDGHRFGFDVPGRDPRLLLVIDPGVEGGGIIGEGRADDSVVSSRGRGVASLTDGGPEEQVLVGATDSGTFQVTPGVFQENYGDNGDAFVVVMNQDMTALVWASFLGGSGNDEASDVAVHESGDVIVLGTTKSGVSDFPSVTATHGALGGTDVFVTRVKKTGATVVGSALLGDDGLDRGNGMDLFGKYAVLTGSTDSPGFPVTADAHQSTYGGGVLESFVTYLDAETAGTDWRMSYSSFLGGGAEDRGMHVVLAESPEGGLPIAYTAGMTNSVDFPVGPVMPGGVISQAQYAGGEADAYLARIAPGSTVSEPYAATYVGGDGYDVVNAIDYAPESGTLAFAGSTDSAAGLFWGGYVFQKDYAGGGMDGFVAMLKDNLNDRDYLSYLGGGGFDFTTGLAIMQGSSPHLTRAVVTGAVYPDATGGGSSFPLRAGAYQESFKGGSTDAFVAVVTHVKNERLLLDYSSFLGGSGMDYAASVRVGEDGVPVVVGLTTSTDFPAPGFQGGGAGSGSQVGFVIKFDPTPLPHSDPQFFTYGGGTWTSQAAPTLHGVMVPETWGDVGQTSVLGGTVTIFIKDGQEGDGTGLLVWGVYGPDKVDMGPECGDFLVSTPIGGTPFVSTSQFGGSKWFDYTIPTDPWLAGVQINWQALIEVGASPCGFLVSNGLQQVIGA